jgi:hypothetical protein
VLGNPLGSGIEEQNSPGFWLVIEDGVVAATADGGDEEGLQVRASECRAGRSADRQVDSLDELPIEA